MKIKAKNITSTNLELLKWNKINHVCDVGLGSWQVYFLHLTGTGTGPTDLNTVLRIPDPESDFFPSRIRIFSIPDPGSASKNLKQKQMFSKLYEIRSGLFIPDPVPYLLPISNPGSRGQKGTGSRIRIRNTAWTVPVGFFTLYYY